jgi:hypothetical protein
MRSVPSVGELRRICHKDGYIPGISRRFIHPHVSIRITRLFLLAGIDGDAITVLMGIVGIGGSLLLFSQNDWVRIAGCVLLLLSWILDHVDGEVLRYQQKSSALGILLDRFSHIVEHPMMHLALGWSLGASQPLFRLLGALNAMAVLMIMAVELEMKLVQLHTGPRSATGPRGLVWLMRKLFGVYRGTTMQGYGTVVLGMLIITTLAGLLREYFVLLSFSIYFNCILIFASALRTAYRTRSLQPSGLPARNRGGGL